MPISENLAPRKYPAIRYVSWHPDPFAVATDAFQISWQGELGYAFPPFSLVGRCLTKVRREGCTIVLIAPTWSTQQWYPVLLELLIDYPLLLPSHKMLLQDPFNRLHPMMLKNQLQLAAWKLSGQVTQQEAFQHGLQHSSRLDRARELTPHTNLDGTGGIAVFWGIPG